MEEYEAIDEEEPHLPANASAGDYLSHVASQPQNFFRRLVRNFGTKMSIQLLIMYLLVKGVVNSGIHLVTLPFCQKTLGVSGENCQTLSAIAATPWALKGAIGVTSDVWPLGGYHKLSYIIITAVIGSTAVLILAALPIKSASLAAILFAAANFQTATGDLLHEGRYSELMQDQPKTGSTIVSYVWGLISVGGLIASCFVGPIADGGNPQIVFWVLLPCALSIIVPTGACYPLSLSLLLAGASTCSCVFLCSLGCGICSCSCILSCSSCKKDSSLFPDNDALICHGSHRARRLGITRMETGTRSSWAGQSKLC